MTAGATTAPTGTAPAPRARLRWTASVRLGAALVLGVALFVGLAPLLPAYDPYGQDLMASLAPPLVAGEAKPYPFGTDALGRDILSRVALAGRISLAISVSAVAISLLIGLTLGMLAGFFGGVVDSVVVALADLQLSIPRILLLIAAGALAGPSAVTLTVLLGLTGWVTYGRVARATALSLRGREFVLAAVTQGATPAWNIRRHILPNVLPQMLILATFDLGQVIVLEASMSYLGLGVQPPLPSWGGMISEGQNFLEIAPWIALAPGIAVFMLVAGVQLVSQRLTSEGQVDPYLAAKAGP